jgi:xylulokinase
MDQLAAARPAGANGVMFTPWLNGERTPVEDHTIRAGWHHLSLRNDRGDLVRAVLEGVAYNSRWLLECVERFTKRPFPWLNVIGGGGQSEVWAQIHADVMNRPVRRVENPIRANARGAALLAGIALGRVGLDDLGGKVGVTAVHEPNPANRKIYDDGFAAFTALYKANKKVHRQIGLGE